jgi:hypothetical protein
MTRLHITAALAVALLGTPIYLTATNFFPNAAKKNASAAVAMDGAGGMHMAYVDYVPVAESPKAVYLYCSAGQGCASADGWSRTEIGSRVTEVQVAVNAAGQPRMLLRVGSEQRGFEDEYHYAECNASCGDAASWTTVLVLGTYGTSIFNLHDDTSPQRSFALDPQGRPRFVYIDRNYPIEPDHMGSYYVWCDANCTNAGNWRETLITESTPYDFEPVKYPSLTFTRAGAPRVLADMFVLSSKNAPSGLHYLSCDTACDRSENWQRVYLVPRGHGTDPSWDLELDAQDRPRVVFYLGALEEGAGEHLFYLWCDSDCLNAENWYYNDPGLGSRNGRHPDLELTADGKPRIAYMHGNSSGFGYLWCDSGCETDTPQWKAGVVDTAETIAAEYPMPLPSGCDAGLWTTLTPVLALDAAGNPFAAFDAKYDTRCWYKDPTRDDPPYYRFTQLWRNVRGAVFRQPAGE